MFIFYINILLFKILTKTLKNSYLATTLYISVFEKFSEIPVSLCVHAIELKLS